MQILLVEDDEAHAELIARAFAEAGEPAPRLARRLSEARLALAERRFDLLLVDLQLPDGDGAELLPGAAGDDACPVVLMTSHGDEQVAVETMRRGARDYVVKSDTALRDMPDLARRVRREWELVREREAAERRLREHLLHAAREWRETFDGLPLGVLVIDGEGRVRRANQFALRQAGESDPTSLLDRRVEEFGAREPWPTLGALARAVLAGEAMASREVRDASGNSTWYAAASPLPEAGGAARAILNFQDVSETARLRERLRQSEMMAEIGALVAGVAHEVRNPLFSISATLDAFESRHGRPPGFDRYLDVLREEIGRLSQVMRELLEFARGAELSLEPTLLADVVELGAAGCRALAASRGVEIRVRRLGPGSPLPIDRQKLSQVFENLISNAIHFSQSGGGVCVEIEQHPGSGSSAGRAECRVRDQGPGFAAADLPRVFEPFFTRRTGGTGLGLSIVRRIVREHGGEVEAANHPEGGALLTLSLPG